MIKFLSKNKGIIGIILLFLIGLSVLLYPTVSNWWNQKFANQVIKDYDKKIASGEIDFKKEFKKAEDYNNHLSPKVVPDAFSAKEHKRDKAYEKCLNVAGGGVMGYVVIPVIDVKLPIYHYTSEKVFKKGAGHLCGSSLPIGGIGTHAVLSAHRGLPSAKMFTDLNLLKKGDCFYMHILNRKMAYKVDQIKTVKPSKTEALQIDKNCDYITLVTCTPYGVNSHRLLVRGHRIPYNVESEHSDARRDVKHILIVLLSILIGGGLAVVVMRIVGKKGIWIFKIRK